jgi:hypothetical protein
MDTVYGEDINMEVSNYDNEFDAELLDDDKEKNQVNTNIDKEPSLPTSETQTPPGITQSSNSDTLPVEPPFSSSVPPNPSHKSKPPSSSSLSTKPKIMKKKENFILYSSPERDPLEKLKRDIIPRDSGNESEKNNVNEKKEGEKQNGKNSQKVVSLKDMKKKLYQRLKIENEKIKKAKAEKEENKKKKKNALKEYQQKVRLENAMRGSQKREDDRRKNDEKEAELLQLGL